MSAMIAGAAPILPAFTEGRAVAALPTATVAVAAPEAADDLSAGMRTMPLFDRQPSAAERAADLAPDLAYAIIRIEGVYDPTRIDATGLPSRMMVTPGTASMANVFADSWHIGDTDANVSYAVRYIAQAWQHDAAAPCSAYLKHRPTVGIVELTSLTPADCSRIVALRGPQDSVWKKLTVASVAVSVPIFAAPEPGARMSSEQFWEAQRARIEAIKARIAFERQRPAATLAAGR